MCLKFGVEGLGFWVWRFGLAVWALGAEGSGVRVWSSSSYDFSGFKGFGLGV